MSLDDLISIVFVMYFSLDVFSASEMDSNAFRHIFSMMLSCRVLFLPYQKISSGRPADCSP